MLTLNKSNMEKDEIFTGFMNFSWLYFREERNIEFYAEKLDVSPEELHEAIKDVSGSNFEEWLTFMGKAD